jgi:hypothetical protein
LQVDDSKVGVLVKCPRCQERFRVPAAPSGPGAGAKTKPVIVKSGASRPSPAASGPKPAPNPDKTSNLEDDLTAYGVQKEGEEVEEDGGEDLVEKHITKTKRRERREQAFEAVAFPAKLISIPAMSLVIILIIVYLFLMWQILMYHYKIKNKEEPTITLTAPTWVVIVANTGWLLGAIVAAGMVVAGAEKMKKLQSYPWALGACCFLPFGVLGLMVLLRPEVKSEFDQSVSDSKSKPKKLADIKPKKKR